MKNLKRFFKFPIILTFVYMVLKLTGVIDWNWLWVASPFWISLSFLLFVSIIITAFTTLLYFFGFNLEQVKNKFNISKNS